MRRLMICLPLCLILSPQPTQLPHRSGPESMVSGGPIVKPKSSQQKEMQRLARTDPVAFLRACLARYDRDVKGYHCTLLMHEPNKVLSAPQKITADFREQPFSVRMDWVEGAGKAGCILYVKGENNDKMWVRGSGRFTSLFVVSRDPKGKEAMDAARYPASEFGIRVGTQRALDAWVAARRRGELKVEFVGEEKRPEVGGKACWVLRRTGYKKPEEDGICETTFYIDKETWLQVGSILTDCDGGLIGSYWFTDIQLNPRFAPDTFTRAGL